MSFENPTIEKLDDEINPKDSEIKENPELNPQELEEAEAVAEVLDKEGELMEKIAEPGESVKNPKAKRLISALVLATAISGFMGAAPAEAAGRQGRRASSEASRIYEKSEEAKIRAAQENISSIERQLKEIDREMTKLQRRAQLSIRRADNPEEVEVINNKLNADIEALNQQIQPLLEQLEKAKKDMEMTQRRKEIVKIGTKIFERIIR
jgi:peptidoglycan hydrolase CwlO-like protein